ncbi:hypothetical protein BDW59DRAFT_157535 [Aspergillus cavernicola]|uniref:FAD-binding PCMH-type domain-containing protein n=1 Tax=Aspergillus cavernicola TaxID=176166 RepID=A0ABR4IWC5_9EURO
MKPFLLVSLLASLAYASPHSSDCRCRPHQSCWPSPKEWNALNRSVDGNLVAVRPVAAVCHDGGAESEACRAVQALWSNSTWRAAQPGAVQYENWEAWPEQNQYCHIQTAFDQPCEQGRISLYSTLATSAADIQKTVRFAKGRNLRLAIKNSGHCFLGRSTAPESLQILTNGMKDIEFVNDFKLKGAPRGRGEGPAVTIAAGVSLQELYHALAEKKRVAVAGAAHTVGAAGGYIQGGGHSFLGPWKGMASDNALQFTVVTADGDLVVANEYQHPDLFWALRGGGGGTFGVVVDVTLRTFDEVPVIVSNLNVSTPAGHPDFWDAMTEFHAHLSGLNDAGGAGYYYIIPQLPWIGNASISGLTVGLMFPNQTDTAKVDRVFAPLLTKLKESPAVTTQYASILLPDIATLVSDVLITGDSDSTGNIVLIGSRLFSRDLLVSEDGPKRLISTLKSLQWVAGAAATGHIVAGGAVAQNDQIIDSAIHPAWREAATHITIGHAWDPNASLAEQEAIRENLTNVEVELLRSVEGPNKMGAYLNEANAYEKDFQSSFWGSNYPRLYAIKQKWDPTGLFITRSGVGSEDWDAEGLCRVKGDHCGR